MSVSSMKKVHQAATSRSDGQPPVYNQTKAVALLDELKKGRITNGEVKFIVDLIEKAKPSSAQAHWALPELVLTVAAERRFNEFLTEHRIPVGANREAMLDAAKDIISAAGLDLYGPTRKPEGINRMPAVIDPFGAGGPTATYYFDVEKQQLYFSTQNVSARTKETFYGPYPTTMFDPDGVGC